MSAPDKYRQQNQRDKVENKQATLHLKRREKANSNERRRQIKIKDGFNLVSRSLHLNKENGGVKHSQASILQQASNRIKDLEKKVTLLEQKLKYTELVIKKCTCEASKDGKQSAVAEQVVPSRMITITNLTATTTIGRRPLVVPSDPPTTLKVPQHKLLPISVPVITCVKARVRDNNKLQAAVAAVLGKPIVSNRGTTGPDGRKRFKVPSRVVEPPQSKASFDPNPPFERLICAPAWTSRKAGLYAETLQPIKLATRQYNNTFLYKTQMKNAKPDGGDARDSNGGVVIKSSKTVHRRVALKRKVFATTSSQQQQGQECFQSEVTLNQRNTHSSSSRSLGQQEQLPPRDVSLNVKPETNLNPPPKVVQIQSIPQSSNVMITTTTSSSSTQPLTYGITRKSEPLMTQPPAVFATTSSQQQQDPHHLIISREMKLNDVEMNNVVGDVEMSDNCHLNTVDHVEVVMNTDEAHHHHHHHATEGNPLNDLCNAIDILTERSTDQQQQQGKDHEMS